MVFRALRPRPKQAASAGEEPTARRTKSTRKPRSRSDKECDGTLGTTRQESCPTARTATADSPAVESQDQARPICPTSNLRSRGGPPFHFLAQHFHAAM